jgi:hypothetical protein
VPEGSPTHFITAAIAKEIFGSESGKVTHETQDELAELEVHSGRR